MREEDIRELLREMGDEPVPVESLVRLRARVAERTRLRPWRRWRIAALLLLPACLGMLALLIYLPIARVPPVNIPTAMRQPEPPVETPLPRPEVTRAPKRLVHHRMAPPRRGDQTGAAALIRIETPDPDVVILLVGD